MQELLGCGSHRNSSSLALDKGSAFLLQGVFAGFEGIATVESADDGATI